MSEEPTIRAMETVDLDRVAALERSCHAHPWSLDLIRRELENPLSRTDLLFRKDDLAGYLCSWQVADELQILNVATAPAFRRCGVARSLMRYVFQRGLEEGLEKAFLEVRVGNAAAIALYRSFGFRIIDRRPKYYADGEDALIMEWTAGEDSHKISVGRK
jgi:ribosomal-protein-alanine N-acetyltransferase